MYINKEIKRGYNPYLSTDADHDGMLLDAGTQMDVGILVLESGDSYVIEDDLKESAVSLLCGDIVIRWSGPEEETVNETRCSRPDMFHYEAACLLAPAGSRIELHTASHAELYIQQTENGRHYQPVLYMPKDVTVQHAGGKGELMGCMERIIKTFFDYDNAPFSNMVLGEVMNYPGKWSSYPPHHHPQPEVYFYRFDKPQGFGAGFANGEAYKTENNGLLVINRGFHSQVAAPGYAMCYLWGIRHLKNDPWLKTRIDEPEHEWLLESDANELIYKD